MQRKLIIEAFRQPGLLIAAQMLMFYSVCPIQEKLITVSR